MNWLLGYAVLVVLIVAFNYGAHKHRWPDD